MRDKDTMLNEGLDLMRQFCELNAIPVPTWIEVPKMDFKTCAYYRPTRIVICTKKCAAIGVAGMAWSYPGYVVDRTPYGVIAHELGHHVDYHKGERKGAYWSEFSAFMRMRAAEHPITTYCPNDAEWFAEMFRLFVTNPDLLSKIRPLTFKEMTSHFEPVYSDTWFDRLAYAPERTINAARNKIAQAARRA